ncbi:hypothetical protein J5J10_11785 [Ciceribacter sp. L1K23]|uniref:head-tail connector protein n=1 Tax=Ciceribacter sp. L1K23 TaxID=2820276 RepID=UPI001B83C0DD|nr:hypothetical protein [Ciceribacter sp. L1K23]MBR0556359.1 hypothetical protein [Ciceribacter sp. L1K23]
MIYAQTAAPAVEPVTLGEVKAHMRMEEGQEDAFLTALVGIARSHLEHTTGLALVSQGFRLYLDRWPQSGIVRIGRGPVRSIEAVTVYDEDGAPQTVPLAGHWLDGYGRPARLWLPDPPAPGRAVNGIEIDFTAGYGESGADVPAELKRAMLMHVALMFSYRGAVAPADQPAAIPDGYDRLVAPYARRGL